MLSPETQYFLDGCLELNQMGPDTHQYFFYTHPDPDGFTDTLSLRPPPARGARKFRHGIEDTALACEEEMVRAIQGNDNLRRILAFSVFEAFDRMVEHFVDNYAQMFVDSGFQEITGLARTRADMRYGMRHSLAVMKRSAKRAYAALDGYDPGQVEHARNLKNQQFDVWQRQQAGDVTLFRDRLTGDEIPAAEAARARKRALLYMRGQQRKHRAALKRSIRLAEEFLGEETTRLFISKQAMRIEGRLATYEIALSRDLTGGILATRLSVLTREGDIRLCDLCIYSNVPTMDHVIGIMLRIKAGEEEEILRTGNARDIDPRAYEEEWLVPYLPRRVIDRNGTPLRLRINGTLRIAAHAHDSRFVALSDPERRERLVAMRPKVTAFLLDEIGPEIPPMPLLLGHLLTGRERNSDVLGVALGQFAEMPERVLPREAERFADRVDLPGLIRVDQSFTSVN